MNSSKRISLISLVFFLYSTSLVYTQILNYTMTTVGKHNDEVLAVYVNEENTKFATSSLDETIKIWSLPDGKELNTLKGHLGAVYNISFSGNDQLLASGSEDMTVRIWDVATGKELKVLRGHTGPVIGVYFSQDDNNSMIASTSFDKTVKLWDVASGAEIKTLRGHTEATNNVAYSYDGKTIASASDDSTIRIWSTDLTTTAPLMVLRGHKAPVLTVLYSFDSQKLASSDAEGMVIIWDAHTGEILRKFKAHDDITQDVAFAADNKTLVTGSLDKHVKLWDTDGPTLLMDTNVGAGVWSVDLVSEASIITVACDDGTVRLLKRSDTQKTKKGKK